MPLPTYLTSGIKETCMGCRACEDICPKHAIKMEADEETFLYPHINIQKCIKCHICESVCPISFTDFIPADNSNAYIGIHKIPQIVENSSSGGAFSAICEELIKKNYTVYGAKFDKKLQVIHSYEKELEKCEVFKKSKYIQSNINGSYNKIANQLSHNENVLFSGVPCQIAALKMYLRLKKIDTNNLFTVSLLCHGTPSQELFDIYIKEKSEIENSNIIKYTFKSKKHSNSRSAEITYSNGKQEYVDQHSDPFLKAYYTRLFYRKSCMYCKFARKDRVADITIADAWKIEKIIPKLNPLKGVSLIITSTVRGEKTFQNLKKSMEIYTIASQWAFSSQRLFSMPTQSHPKRSIFFKKLREVGFYQAVEETTRLPKWRLFLHTIKQLISKLFIIKKQ